MKSQVVTTSNTAVTVSGLVNGDDRIVQITASGSQTEVGSSRNGYTINWGTVNPNNYAITVNYGTLTITPAAVVPAGGVPAAPAIVPPTPDAPVIVPDDPTPQVDPGDDIPDDPTPHTDPDEKDKTDNNWALLNLILAAASVIMALAMVITFITGKEDESGEKKRNGLKFLGLIPGIGAIIAFLLTEKFGGDMVFTDKWTILMAVIAAISIVLTIVIKNKANSKNNNDDQEI